MNFSLDKSIEILSSTPYLLETWLKGLGDEWVTKNEGPETWSPYDVVGHLIHGEKTDWIPRMQIILSDKADKTFEPFDRFAQFTESKGKTLKELIAEFKTLRQKNIQVLLSKNITSEMLDKEGRHPSLGKVTLRQLLSTWVVHDLEHIAQISRVMAKQYENQVGPWSEYLPILKKR